MKIVKAVAAAAFFLFFSVQVFAQDESSKHFIQIDSAGFSPDKLDIKQGETVVFQNNGRQAHWPASNIHPTHDIYPEFDPQHEIAPGESWEFKFERAGTWRMHDHLFPNLTGEIVVVGDGGASPNLILEFFQDKFLELKNLALRFYYQLFPFRFEEEWSKVDLFALKSAEGELARWLAIWGPEKVMAKLLEDSGGGSGRDCHQEAHQIGRIAYEVLGSSVFQKGNSSCHSGFYHGAMEAFLNQEGTNNLGPKISKLCDSFKTSFSQFECLHGVGHGVAAYEDYDLPAAIAVCQSLETEFAQSSCYGGVFMENIVTAQGIGAIPGHETKWVSADPHFPCNAIDPSYDIQVQCYLMQTSRMLDIYAYDFGPLVAGCFTAPDEMRDICFQSYGRDAAGQTLRDPAKIIALCQKVPGEYFGICIRGALYVIVDFWGERVVDQPQALCKLLDGEARGSCYLDLISRLTEIFGNDEEKIGQVCNLIDDPNYQKECLLL